MLCERCKKNPVASHFTKIINGVKTESHLCVQCAAEVGIFSDFDFGHDFFSLFSPEAFSEKSYLHGREKEKECPFCKSTFSDISRTGKVGCAKCYDTFKEELMPYISRIHGRAEYKGEESRKIEEDPLKGLKEALTEAIKKQEFEKACEIRDKIRELESGKDEKLG